jgi:hypothetical protein
MPVIEEITAACGTYQDSEGQDKTRWHKIGVVIEKDGKRFIKLEVIPLGWDGFASLFPPREKDEKKPRNASLPGYQAPGQSSGYKPHTRSAKPKQAAIDTEPFDGDSDIPF